MIEIVEIQDSTLDNLIHDLDESLVYIKSQFGIQPKSYERFLRVALNNIQPDALCYLLERLNINRELERQLDNAGGYSMSFLGDNNPKSILTEIIKYLCQNPAKSNKIKEYFFKNRNSKTVVAEINDIDYLKLLIADPTV